MSEQKLSFILKPQVNLSCPSGSRMWLICGCAFLCVFQSAIGDSGMSLTTAFAAFLSSLLVELLLTWREFGPAKIMDGSSAATAMILCLLLPNQIHPVYAALGVIFAVVVVKYSFGGLGANWLNPALAGWLFIRLSWPHAFTNAFKNSSDAISELSVTSVPSMMGNRITDFLNNSILSITSAQLPSGYIDLFFNKDPGIMADRGIFFLLAGTVVITAAGINRGWIPLVFLAVYGFLVRLAGNPGLYWEGDMLYGFFSGGTIAAAFILAAEPASSAKLKTGVLITVVIAAVLSWFLRYKCMEFYGCFFALAVVNCITPLVRHAEEILFLSRNECGKFQENIK
ncbi:MAG: RnfABCDGE type electron transport complex subunit D [Treponema sp.]|nr:RnfABCDGE type electron transport complex subunit D [Treponema sp.]